MTSFNDKEKKSRDNLKIFEREFKERCDIIINFVHPI